MLSYAFTTLNQGGYEDVATEEFENMHNLFAAILAKGISRQLKQGLYREYLNRSRCSWQNRYAGDHTEPSCQKAGIDLRV